MNETILPVCINLYEGPGGAETSFQDRVYLVDKISVAITSSFRPWYLVPGNEDRNNNE